MCLANPDCGTLLFADNIITVRYANRSTDVGSVMIAESYVFAFVYVVLFACVCACVFIVSKLIVKNSN